MITSHTIEGGMRISLRDKKGNSTVVSDVEELVDSNSNIEFLITNSEGKVESKTSIPFRSFTPNFIRAIANSSFNTSYPVKRTTGATTTSGDHLNIASDVNESSSYAYIGSAGIVFGTGSVAKSVSDYKLGGIITHGSGPNQLFYGEMQGNSSFSQATSVSSPVQAAMYSISENVSNVSSQSITVREIGLYSCGRATSSNYAMLARDTTDYSGSVINISVSPGKTLNARYNIYLNSSNGWTLQFAAGLLSRHVYFYQTGYTFRARNILGGIITSLSYNYISFSNASEGVILQGAVCGSSSVPQSPDNYQIYGLYQHGTGLNQLFYDAVQVLKAPTDFNEDPTEWIVYRDIFNYSSNPITVSEVGWYSGYSSTGSYTIMINRKVLNEPVVIQPDSSLRVELLFRTRYL